MVIGKQQKMYIKFSGLDTKCTIESIYIQEFTWTWTHKKNIEDIFALKMYLTCHL